MIKFEVGKRYYFKARDLSRMFGKCIGRNELNGIESVVFSFPLPQANLFSECLVEYPMDDFEEIETVYSRLGDKLYMSDSRWVSE